MPTRRRPAPRPAGSRHDPFVVRLVDHVARVVATRDGPRQNARRLEAAIAASVWRDDGTKGGKQA